jgi:hypothetical protein
VCEVGLDEYETLFGEARGHWKIVKATPRFPAITTASASTHFRLTLHWFGGRRIVSRYPQKVDGSAFFNSHQQLRGDLPLSCHVSMAVPGELFGQAGIKKNPGYA